MTDPIADMLTRIRNGSTARHSIVEIPSSRMKVEIARLMTEQGYVVGYAVKQGEHGEVIHVELKYGKNRERAQGARRARHSDHLNVTRACDQRRSAQARPGWRSDLLHLVRTAHVEDR
jgi:small subunit ribosomal protein S8